MAVVVEGLLILLLDLWNKQMNVLVLGIVPSPLTPILKEYSCNVVETDIQTDINCLKKNSIDFIISYRYRHIIKKPIIEYVKGNIINLHISLLPWNRGADPNLWSFLEDTPKGCTIHYIDDGIDTGDIIIQKPVVFEPKGETLATTYNKLNAEVVHLFRKEWPRIMNGDIKRTKQIPFACAHRLTDKQTFEYLLDKKGWDTDVEELTGKATANQLNRKNED
jgi:methionyl-tRNA formyltransferase